MERPLELTTERKQFQQWLTFEAMAMFLTQEEWGYLDPAPRSLYKDVMMDSYGKLVSLGKNARFF